MRLRALTGLEREKLENEHNELQVIIANLKAILADEKLLLGVIKEEITGIAEKYGDDRKTQILPEQGEVTIEDLTPNTPMAVFITHQGYLKRISLDTFERQNRATRGKAGIKTKEDDDIQHFFTAMMHDKVLFFSSKGIVYSLNVYDFPEGGRQSKGLPIVNLLPIEKDEKINNILLDDGNEDNKYLVITTKNGLIKRTNVCEFENIRKNGKIAITLKEDDEVLSVHFTTGNDDIVIASNNGRMIRFNENEIRVMGRTASGVKSINVGDGEVVGVTTSSEGKYVLVLTNKGYGKMSEMDEYRVMAHRGGKGVTTIKSSEKNGHLVCMKAVNGDEDLLIVTNKGVMIRVPLEQVKIASRNTQGVRVIRLDGNSEVSSLEVTAKEDEEVIEETTPTSETVELAQE
jgi:DNA gyrase subunit A